MPSYICTIHIRPCGVQIILDVAFMSCFLKKKHFNSLVSSNSVRCVMIHGGLCVEMDGQMDSLFAAKLTLARPGSRAHLAKHLAFVNEGLGYIRVDTKSGG